MRQVQPAPSAFAEQRPLSGKAGRKVPRAVRCGQCDTCARPHLKKVACLRTHNMQELCAHCVLESVIQEVW